MSLKVQMVLALITILLLQTMSARSELVHNLNQTFDDFDTQILNIMETEGVMGLAFSIMKDQKIVYSKGFGYSDFYRHIPMTADTRFRIASISQHIATIALMTLYDDKKFDFDTDVSTYLGFQLVHPLFPDQKITLRHILTHTSGLNDGPLYDQFLTDTYKQIIPPKAADLLQAGGKYYSDQNYHSHAPGTYFTYCNMNFGIVGTVIQKLSGERFDIYVKQRVFQRMLMQTSYNVADVPNINDLAVLYTFSNGTWVEEYDSYKGVAPQQRDLSQYNVGDNGFIYGPQGGLRVTAPELLKLANLMMNEGRFQIERILSQESVLLMLQPHWVYNGQNGDNMGGMGRAWGFATHITTNTVNNDVVFPDRTMKGHTGAAYGLVSNLFYDVQSKVGFSFAINGCSGGYHYGPDSRFVRVEASLMKLAYQYITTLSQDPIYE